MSVQIRDAIAQDAERISALTGDLGYKRPPQAIAVELDSMAKRAAERVLVAIDRNVVVGFASLDTVRYFHAGKSLCRVTALSVAAENRGSGIGKALLAACEAHGRAAGCAAMEVTSALDRHDAHCFYRHVGYSGVATKFSKGL